jgi:hypothetical protein
MFCDRCGTELQAGQRFCASCGKAIGVSVVPQPSDGRVSRHIQILAVLWLASSALNLIGGVIMFVLGGTLFGRMRGVEIPFAFSSFLHGLFFALGILVLLKALAGFAAGWGLLERQPWARTLTLVLGFVSLLNLPLGTALGIYTIWVLLAPQADEEYRRLARAA